MFTLSKFFHLIQREKGRFLQLRENDMFCLSSDDLTNSESAWDQRVSTSPVRSEKQKRGKENKPVATYHRKYPDPISFIDMKLNFTVIVLFLFAPHRNRNVTDE